MSSDKIDNPVESVEENDYIAFPRVFPGLFTREECERIIGLSENIRLEESEVGREGKRSKVHLYTRSSRTGWMVPGQDTEWVFERIREAVGHVNQYYRFELTGFMPLQVTQYLVGGHYNWHVDIGAGDISRRKLSLSVQLSDPASYGGGDLEFTESSGSLSNKDENRQQGSVIIFPSYLTHQVSIVTRGVRWALISWILGPPFR